MTKKPFHGARSEKRASRGQNKILRKLGRSSMTLTKAGITEKIFNATYLKQIEASRVIETLLEIIKSRLESGEDVLISGFGKFCVNEKNERKGRNPQSGKDLLLGPRKVVTFHCSSVLRKKMNGKR
jgi:integration host factor subunit alpha